MGLKIAWSVKDYYKCCGNCIHVEDIYSREKLGNDIYGNNVPVISLRIFYCKVGVKIKNNDINFQNVTYCINHRFNMSFKKKIKTTKYKSKMVKVNQKIYRTLVKEYPYGN